MKKLFLALVCFASVAFFASCNPTGEPTITMNADKTSIASGETVAFTIQADASAESQKDLKDVKFDVVCNGDNIYTNTEEVNAATYSNVYELKFDGNNGDEFVVTATVTDVAGKTKSATVTVTIEAAAALLVEAPFTWTRNGGNPGTGLEEFGLQWNSNNSKATYAVIEPVAGAKLYELTTSAYTAATTEAEKEAAFEGLTEISQWKEFDVTGAATQTLDKVLGTLYNGEYHLIHITKGEINSTKGYIFTLSGMAK